MKLFLVNFMDKDGNSISLTSNIQNKDTIVFYVKFFFHSWVDESTIKMKEIHVKNMEEFKNLPELQRLRIEDGLMKFMGNKGGSQTVEIFNFPEPNYDILNSIFLDVRLKVLFTSNDTNGYNNEVITNTISSYYFISSDRTTQGFYNFKEEETNELSITPLLEMKNVKEKIILVLPESTSISVFMKSFNLSSPYNEKVEVIVMNDDMLYKIESSNVLSFKPIYLFSKLFK